jgi:hypothetical protein
MHSVISRSAQSTPIFGFKQIPGLPSTIIVRESSEGSSRTAAPLESPVYLTYIEGEKAVSMLPDV